MRRLLVLLALLTLGAAACSGSADDVDQDADIDSNLGTIEVAVKEDSPGLEKGDRLLDAAVGVDGVLYLALKGENGRHRLLSLRVGRAPRVLADEVSVPGFAPTAVAVDSRLRIVYVASRNEVLTFRDSHGAEGGEQLVIARGPPGTPGPQGGAPPPSALIGPPRYMAFDGRTDNLYIADSCRIVRYGTRRIEVDDMAEVAGGPGADCLTMHARITGLAVDQRTGDVYVGRGDELRLWDENWIGRDGAGNLYVSTRTLPNELGDAPVQIRKVIAAAL